MKPKLLPKYVSRFIDTRGVERIQFRKAGFSRKYFKASFGTEDFRSEYREFLNCLPTPKETTAARNVVPRSIDDLLNNYYKSSAFKGNAIPMSLAKRRSILEKFRTNFGTYRVAMANYQSLDRIIAQEAVKNLDGSGGPFAAVGLKKQLTRLFKYAVKIGWIISSPMDHVEFKIPRTNGYHSWTEDDILKYQNTWAIGTKQRLALELMLWTGKRRSDVVALSRKNLQDGKLVGRDIKTGKTWVLPIAPQLKDAIEALPPHGFDHYLVSERGRPYTAASFGNMFREWCDAADLKHCSAHGLRKAIMRRMAEIGIGNAGMKAISLHSNDAEVSLYVAAANQSTMAETAIAELSKWEVSHQHKTRSVSLN